MAYIAKFLDRFKDYGSLYIPDALPLVQYNNSLLLYHYRDIHNTVYNEIFCIPLVYSKQSEESML